MSADEDEFRLFLDEGEGVVGSDDDEESTVAEDVEETNDEDEEDAPEKVYAAKAQAATKPRVTAKPSPHGSGPLSQSVTKSLGWSDLHISRPLLRALAAVGWDTPTDIQLKSVPAVLEGRDVLGTAETGSGKTAAFLLPVLERLLCSPAVIGRKRTKAGIVGGRVATKALILLPTRELANQCFEVLQLLSQFSCVTSTLASGGMDIKSQELTLRNQPDIVVATPGRVLDLLLNSQTVNMELLEIVVFDEADRLLDLGFKAECLAVLKQCAKDRQTLLFSATLTDGISDLAVLALKNPVKVATNKSHTVVASLRQEFVKLPKDDAEIAVKQKRMRTSWREAALLHLCSSVYTSRVIIFFQRKVDAHRMAKVFEEFGLPCSELHGNLLQSQRINNYKKFVNGEVQFLLASELASRGLDIQDVETVINYHLAWDLARHVHRVGRTARMGRSGVAVTLFEPSELAKVKKFAKASGRGSGSSLSMTMRTVPVNSLREWREKIEGASDGIRKALYEEQLEKEFVGAEAAIKHFDDHKDDKAGEILASRQAREWHMDRKSLFDVQNAKRSADMAAKEDAEGTNEEDTKGQDEWEDRPEGGDTRKRGRKGKVDEGRRDAKKAKKGDEKETRKGEKGKLTRKEREAAAADRQAQAAARGVKKQQKSQRIRKTSAFVAHEREVGIRAVQERKQKAKRRKTRASQKRKRRA